MTNASISDAQSLPQDLQSHESAALKGKTHLKILIVDDDDQFRGLIMWHLMKKGFHNVSLAEDGEEGIKQALAVKPDIVILDTVLPPTNGFDVCRQIIQIPGLESTKIIMITTSFRKIDPKRSRRVGANIYTLKTKDFSCIMEAISEMSPK